MTTWKKPFFCFFGTKKIRESDACLHVPSFFWSHPPSFIHHLCYSIETWCRRIYRSFSELTAFVEGTKHSCSYLPSRTMPVSKLQLKSSAFDPECINSRASFIDRSSPRSDPMPIPRRSSSLSYSKEESARMDREDEEYEQLKQRNQALNSSAMRPISFRMRCEVAAMR